MKRIIALIVLICCCCVYSAYSLVQPLSLTRTTGSSSTPSQQTSLPMYAPPPSDTEPTCYCSNLDDGTSELGFCFFCLNYDDYEADLSGGMELSFANATHCWKSENVNSECVYNNSEPLCDHEHKFYAETAERYGYNFDAVRATNLKCCYYMHEGNYNYGDINAINFGDNGEIEIKAGYSPWLYFCEADPTQCEWKIKHPNNQSLQLYNNTTIESYLNKIKDFVGDFPTEGEDILCRISALNGDEEPIDDVRIFYANASLPSCDDDYSPYETSEYSSPCKISIVSYNNDNDGSGGERGLTGEYLLGYQKQPEEPAIPNCSSIFDENIISLLRSDGGCAQDHDTKYCVHDGVTKPYCSTFFNGLFCTGDFSPYYYDTYTETCPIETIDDSLVVGYKKPEEEAVSPEYCSNIFSDDIIDLLRSDGNCNPYHETKSCVLNGVTKYYCSAIAAGTFCKGDFSLYYDDTYTETCPINNSQVVGYKKPEVTCQDVFGEKTSSIIGILPEKSTIECGSYVSGSCTYDSKVYSFCYGVTIQNACPDNSDEYSREYTSSYTEPCSYTLGEPDGHYNGMDINILGFTQKDTDSCENKIQDYFENDNWLYVRESYLNEEDREIKDNFITDTCIDNGTETYIYRICTFEEVCNREDVNGSTSSCNYVEGLYTCKCPNGWMTIEEYRSLNDYTEDTIITGIGNACKAEKVEKFSEFEVVLGIDEYPSCQDIIDYQNASGDPTKPKDGYYDYCSDEIDRIACHNSDTMAALCRYCGADDATSNDYDFSKSFKINADNNLCPQGCHEDYACSYTKTDGTTITYCSQCDCSGYASKLELCSVGFEGEENNTEILASPCYTSGKVDENESCKLSPIDNTLPTTYKKILCPDDYVTLEDWLETSQTIIDENEFLGNNLNISNENQWINYFVPQTDEGSVCDYAVEVVESGSSGTDVDSDIEDTNDPENRLYEIISLETKYKGFNLNCQALVETLPNLEFINQAYLHNYNDYTTCWDIEGNQEKYLATCEEDYLLPEEGYEVIGNEDVCKFNGKDYYKYGGSCPVIFSGKEAVVAESTSDDAIRNLYGSVKISYCNDKGVKKKVTLCDPNIYNQICEYPYTYAYGLPQKEWCFRNIRGKAVNPYDTANNVKYYINTGLPIQCEYVPESCDSILQQDSSANNVFIEDSPNDCIKKYGTAVQTKLCSGDNNIPKYACYYPKDTYKYTTQNCPIGRDLSRPYILINGVKHWDRCDCPPAYKYHVNNCRVYDLGGDTCEQQIDPQFIDMANDPTLPTSGSIKLYTKCNDPQINQPNGCKTPLGTWAKCYYCCPKGTRATGNLSIDSCGAKIYECK